MVTGRKPPAGRLAIIGVGSSGLICLKTALDVLPGWEVVCFEKSEQIIGCWGDPYPGFVSTSTKYTTQFACFPNYDACSGGERKSVREEFFCDDEYGKYLERFADAFHLRRHIQFCRTVRHIRRAESGGGWNVWLSRTDLPGDSDVIEHFDQVILCTGLAVEAKRIDCAIPVASPAELQQRGGISQIRKRRIVVIGGGESAVDYAHRLARPEAENQVFLSLRSGIRVSPRYHPIRGVPSDFLRNRLMLSIHEDLRNRIGELFVKLRIRYQEHFERLFPPRIAMEGRPDTPQAASGDPLRVARVRKEWARKLMRGAKGELFNMFHNKSDDFLDSIAAGRLTVVGQPLDDKYRVYRGYDSQHPVDVAPDTLVPAIGYASNLETLSGGTICLTDFYLGCSHVSFPDLFAVGFARPIIGNVPTISEVQAWYVCSMISGDVSRPENIRELHEADRARQRRRYRNLDLQRVYPVEMFPYCDELARRMGVYPSIRAAGSLRTWCRMQLAPATTLHYLHRDPSVREHWKTVPIYMPWTLVLLLLLLKPIDAIYRMGLRLTRLRPSRRDHSPSKSTT